MDNVGGVLFCLPHGERGNHSGCTGHDTQKVTQEMHLKQSENKACKKIHNNNNHNHRYRQHLLKTYYALGSVLSAFLYNGWLNFHNSFKGKKYRPYFDKQA